MDVKRDILWRVYLSFILIVLVCILILSKAFYIQQVQGKYWRGLKRALKAFNCLQVQERRVDLRVFDRTMDFSDISFAVEDKVDGIWHRTDVVFEKNFEQDGYEILS